MADAKREYRTKRGTKLSDADIDRMATDAARDRDVDDLKTRRRGRPAMGSSPADVVPVRLDPALKRAVESRTAADHSTTSAVNCGARYSGTMKRPVWARAGTHNATHTAKTAVALRARSSTASADQPAARSSRTPVSPSDLLSFSVADFITSP